jgi:4-carboxymuconolactone decarboxylase
VKSEKEQPVSQRREQGKQIYLDVMRTEPPSRDSIFVNVGQLDQEFAELWSRTDRLSRKDRRWITMTCLAGRSATGPLREHIYGALESGDITVDELSEAVLHFALYGGFARAEPFDAALLDVMVELGLSSTDRADRSSRDWSSDDERQGAAADVQQLVFPGTPRMTASPEESVLERYGTKRVVYAEIWARSGITRRERRLISLTCAALAGAARATELHWQGAIDSGDLTPEELGEFALQFAFYAGWPQAQILPRGPKVPPGS